MDHGHDTCRSTSALREKRKIASHFRHQQGRRTVTLRLVAGDFHAVVDFRAFEALCASKVELVVKVSGVSNERIFLQLLLVVQSEETRW